MIMGPDPTLFLPQIEGVSFSSSIIIVVVVVITVEITRETLEQKYTHAVGIARACLN